MSIIQYSDITNSNHQKCPFLAIYCAYFWETEIFVLVTYDGNWVKNSIIFEG